MESVNKPTKAASLGSSDFPSTKSKSGNKFVGSLRKGLKKASSFRFEKNGGKNRDSGSKKSDSESPPVVSSCENFHGEKSTERSRKRKIKKAASNFVKSFGKNKINVKEKLSNSSSDSVTKVKTDDEVLNLSEKESENVCDGNGLFPVPPPLSGDLCSPAYSRGDNQSCSTLADEREGGIKPGSMSQSVTTEETKIDCVYDKEDYKIEVNGNNLQRSAHAKSYEDLVEQRMSKIRAWMSQEFGENISAQVPIEEKINFDTDKTSQVAQNSPPVSENLEVGSDRVEASNAPPAEEIKSDEEDHTVRILTPSEVTVEKFGEYSTEIITVAPEIVDEVAEESGATPEDTETALEFIEAESCPAELSVEDNDKDIDETEDGKSQELTVEEIRTKLAETLASGAMPQPNNEKREHLYKILVIGELGTGKTSFIKRYVHQFFSQHYRATIGVDFALKVINWDADTIIRLQLWDIAGQERFGNMTRVYYKEAVGAFIVFDVTRVATFDSVMKWKQDLDSKVQLPDGSQIPCILLANKCDQQKEGLVNNSSKMDEYCKEKGFAGWFETSAKENINIEEAARCLVTKILLSNKALNHSDGLKDSDRFALDGINVSKSNHRSCAC